jgi:hypothetical protein
VAIAIGSLAFWLNQPAHLFNGGASSSASATEAPAKRKRPSLMHGLLSLELLSAMQRDSKKLTPHRCTSTRALCERKASTAASAGSPKIRADSARAGRTIAR